jgi:RNAse (barnase) inhibitor barstar
MTLKEFVLDGRNMKSEERFYKEIERVLCPSLKKMGRNLHALRDILRGGFGAFEEGEQIQIRIVKKKQMRKHLQEGFVRQVFKILEESENVILMKGEAPKEDTY